MPEIAVGLLWRLPVYQISHVLRGRRGEEERKRKCALASCVLMGRHAVRGGCGYSVIRVTVAATHGQSGQLWVQSIVQGALASGYVGVDVLICQE